MPLLAWKCRGPSRSGLLLRGGIKWAVRTAGNYHGVIVTCAVRVGAICVRKRTIGSVEEAH